MTTIAYRNGILAADSATSIHDGNLRSLHRAEKLRELSDKSWFAVCGDYALADKFAARWNDGKKSEQIAGNSTFVVLLPDGKIWIFEGGASFELKVEFAAYGSGAGIALGAMHMGASAIEAVEAACRFDPWTSEPIDYSPIRKDLELVAGRAR